MQGATLKIIKDGGMLMLVLMTFKINRNGCYYL